MQTNQLLLLFCTVLLLLGLVAFFVGRAKAARVRASGAAMYAQPDQYAWFAVLSTAGPAVLVGALGSLLLLLLGADIPPMYLLAASLVVAAAGLAVGVAQVKPHFHARQAIERVIRWVLTGRDDIDLYYLRYSVFDHFGSPALFPNAQLLGVHYRYNLEPWGELPSCRWTRRW